MIGLYVHIPFCAGKCPYCDFYSVEYESGAAFAYGEAVLRNVDFYNERYDTVYFGGGTPSLLGWEIGRILSRVRYSAGAEITVEANPGSISVQGLILLRDSGVTRLSFGVQSFSNNELNALGRRHTSDEARSAVTLAAENGFDNISVDLMLGIPRQTPESVRRSVKMISGLPVKHVSAYMLKLEPNTPFGQKPPAVPGEDETAAIYLAAVEALEGAGFRQYEISNFARPGYECRHNLKYWECKEYLGIGPMAHSYYDGERFYAGCDVRSFVNYAVQPTVVTDDKPLGFADYAMLRLRLVEGLSFAECEKLGVNRDTLLERTKLVPAEYIVVDEDGISLTRSGFLLSNQIIGKLVYG